MQPSEKRPKVISVRTLQAIMSARATWAPSATPDYGVSRGDVGLYEFKRTSHFLVIMRPLLPNDRLVIVHGQLAHLRPVHLCRVFEHARVEFNGPRDLMPGFAAMLEADLSFH